MTLCPSSLRVTRAFFVPKNWDFSTPMSLVGN